LKQNFKYQSSCWGPLGRRSRPEGPRQNFGREKLAPRAMRWRTSL